MYCSEHHVPGFKKGVCTWGLKKGIWSVSVANPLQGSGWEKKAPTGGGGEACGQY